MLHVLQGARLLVNGTSGEWHLSPGEWRAQPAADRPTRHGVTIGGWLARAVAAVRRAQRERQVIRDLSAMNDRLLADMGIARNEIRAVAKGQVSRRPGQTPLPASPTARVRYHAPANQATANDAETRTAA